VNYELLFDELRDRRIRIALTGANGGFGRTFLAQCRVAPQVELSVLCDRDVEGLRATLLQMEFAPEALQVCASEADVRAAGGRIALVAQANWLAQAPHDIVIEATGAPETSVAIAEAALRRRVHVGMVTKETDSVVGPWLNRLALEHGVVYTTVDGDQPAALIGLVTWARVLGFDVVCAGKASEHDFVHDARRGGVTHAGVSRVVPGLENLWTFGTDLAATLEARRRALHEFPQSATPDYCEMNVVANSTGLEPACDALSYPLCRTSELADVFVPVEDGGILTRTGVVDVFNPLRRSDEASFGGGMFVIVRCTDRAVWQLLQEKGHVVGRSGKYACIYQPFHLMGLESLTSVYSAVLHGRASGSSSQWPHAQMLARATRDLRAGEVLTMGGHMHEIEGVAARLLPARDAQDAAPYYLAANRRLLRDVARGDYVPAAALALEGSALARAWTAMRSSETD
jgi:predicted homoserine dehydrogenase-like protein